MDKKFFDELAKSLSAAIPSSVKSIQKDLEKNFRSILQSAFSKLDLVTREEFDAQAKVLRRSRDKLEKLEKQVSQLEKALPQKAKPKAKAESKVKK